MIFSVDQLRITDVLGIVMEMGVVEARLKIDAVGAPRLIRGGRRRLGAGRTDAIRSGVLGGGDSASQ
jgi:hypothetical protein